MLQSGNGRYKESKEVVTNWIKICGNKDDIRDFLFSDPHKTEIANKEEKKQDGEEE